MLNNFGEAFNKREQIDTSPEASEENKEMDIEDGVEQVKGLESMAKNEEKELRPETGKGKSFKKVAVALSLFAASFATTSALSNLDYTEMMKKGKIPGIRSVEAKQLSPMEKKMKEDSLYLLFGAIVDQNPNASKDEIYAHIYNNVEPKSVSEIGQDAFDRAIGSVGALGGYLKWRQEQQQPQTQPASSFNQPQSVDKKGLESRLNENAKKTFDEINFLFGGGFKDKAKAVKAIRNIIFKAIQEDISIKGGDKNNIRINNIKDFKNRFLENDTASMTRESAAAVGKVFKIMEERSQ